MAEITGSDLCVIALYLLFMLAVGVWFIRRIKNTDDYYVAGRTLGPVVLAATICAKIIRLVGGEIGISYEMGASPPP